MRVLDAFHVTRLGLTALDEVRRRVQQDTLHRRGHRDDPLYRIRRLLRRAPETLSERAWTRLETELVLGDPAGEVTQAWMAAHELRYLYRRGHDLSDSRRRLHDVLSRCVFSDIPELLRLARTLDAWTEELLAYFTTGGISNGPTEAINLLIKRIKRVGFGFRNFDNYRLRLLLHDDSAGQRLRARRQGRQTAPGRLRLLAQPAHPRQMVPHKKLPRLRRRPRPHRAGSHHRRPVRQALAARRPRRSLTSLP